MLSRRCPLTGDLTLQAVQVLLGRVGVEVLGRDVARDAGSLAGHVGAAGRRGWGRRRGGRPPSPLCDSIGDCLDEGPRRETTSRRASRASLKCSLKCISYLSSPL